MNSSTDSAARAAIWPTLNYTDALAAIDFLERAFGFSTVMVVPNETDDTIVEHCQMAGPEGGGIMLGTANRLDNPFSMRPTGAGSIYVVTERPDELYDRATAAGAEVFWPLRDEDYGSRGFSVTDPEGNVWSFGTYVGEG
jgi:uncharacterized glyoxalase superfamily protein PhnB